MTKAGRGILFTVLLASCGSPPGPPPRKPVTPNEALLDYYAHCVRRCHAEGGRWPTSILELYVKPEGMFTWKGPYLDGAPPPKDEWGREVAYEATVTGFELRSAGPDGAPGTADDVVVQGR